MFNPISHLLNRQTERYQRPETPEDAIGAAIYFRRGLDILPGTIDSWELRADGWEGSSPEHPVVRLLVNSPALRFGPVWVHEEDFVCYTWERQAVAA